MKSLFLIVIILSSLHLQAQDSVLVSLEKIAFSMLNDQDESKRLAFQDQVSHLLDSILLSPDSWNKSFEGIKSIAILTSPDQRFRIFNWNVPYNDGTYKFFGLVQIKASRKNSYQVIRLTDYSNELTKASSKSLSENQWFGALYYSILEKKYKKKVYYVLLGWDGNTAFSNKKLIDVLQIGADNSVSFGAPLFDDGKRLRHRVFFEHSERCTMSLRYQEKNDWIVFDHLAPSQPSLTGQYEFYGPDFTFDAFKWEKGRFKFYSDVDVRNEGKNEGKQTKKPERGLQPEGVK
jgi:hypothetical protein